MSAHVLLNLLNELGKEIICDFKLIKKWRQIPNIYLGFLSHDIATSTGNDKTRCIKTGKPLLHIL